MKRHFVVIVYASLFQREDDICDATPNYTKIGTNLQILLFKKCNESSKW
jgi:hypothetical protein